MSSEKSIEEQLNPLLKSENCPVDGNGNFLPPPSDDTISRICNVIRKETQFPNDDVNPQWELSESPDSGLIDNYVSETTIIGGATVNVHRLLGVHEQGKLQDLTGNGNAISNGSHPSFPASNAFDKFNTEWHSTQTGSDVVKTAYIGYDFGEILLDNGRKRYGLETFVKFDVASIRIRQGCRSENRVTKARIERSNDGKKWYGASIVQLPDCEGMVTINFRKTVPSRWWRIRPLEFNGGATDHWSIQAIQLMDYESTNIQNIQDRIFLENRDRDYDENPVRLKGVYVPFDQQSFQSKFGFGTMFGGDEWIIELSFSSIIGLLGRPFVIGDIIQLPSETQFNTKLEAILKYLEVTDVAWSANSYTPNWVPLMQRIIAKPVMASQETQDILGKLTESIDEIGTSDINDGLFDKKYQDVSSITQTIEADQNTEVPVDGEDYSKVAKISQDFYDWAEEQSGSTEVARRIDRARSHFGVDAMPPNGEPYTEGDEFPSNPKDGDYHRLTYTNIRSGIPARLHRWSSAKKRWIFLEKDRRAEFKDTQSRLQDFLDPSESSVTNPDDIFE